MGVTFVFEIVGGPDAGRLVGVAPGRHLVGRAAGCGVVIDDPSVESHHVVIDADAAGTLRLTQLAGRRPVLVDGQPIEERMRLGAGAAIELGDTLLARRDAGAGRRRNVGQVGHTGRGTVVLGVGTVRVPVDAAAGDRSPVELVELVEIERREVHHGHPVLADLARTDRMVIGLTATRGDTAADAARNGVLTSIVTQLAADPESGRWPVVHLVGGRTPGPIDASAGRVVLVSHLAAPLADGGVVHQLVRAGAAVTTLLLVEPSSPALERCDAVLRLGARWRGQWVGDVADPLSVVRLHARGQRPRPWRAEAA